MADANESLLKLAREAKVVTNKEAEAEADFLVCGPDSYFQDDVRGVCSTCGDGVVFRSHAPSKPKRICIKCFSGMEKPKRAHITEDVYREVSHLLKGE